MCGGFCVIGGRFCGCPYNQSPTTLRFISGPMLFGTPHMSSDLCQGEKDLSRMDSVAIRKQLQHVATSFLWLDESPS